MGKFIKGEIVVIPFPFSDLSGSKKRPALVLADLDGDDILLCQITSQNGRDRHAISLCSKDFATGSLPVDSFIRPARIFTAHKGIIVRKAGVVNGGIMVSVTQKIFDILK
ncbi:type II toxin-antitoxin system PemK/MazF family toxin [Dyadobacter sp. CY323]|uniref:type II toxin-antitoxin system PemK/MazF family toxin n=1 Tax=Dyadobacter sp. CY323 TaxID=2907302 RepID=UPI001F44C5BE|nr:type II toxin-antitoxin system PemK/MazF family toxin [Dyadobacter sp. CY323]MCE6990904.1 type II toxin-antitoxin system PemK/MazF family toxin [Dyadobacter sp. CY323]